MGLFIETISCGSGCSLKQLTLVSQIAIGYFIGRISYSIFSGIISGIRESIRENRNKKRSKR